MRELLLVGIGGFFGAACRFGIGSFLNLYLSSRLPVGTLLVNLIGCFLIGYLSGAAEKSELLNPQLRLLLMTGVLGGFTTFSAFGLETVQLLRRSELSMALLYVSISVFGGVLAVWLGLKLAGTKLHLPS